MNDEGMTYEDAGVDYGPVDSFKREAQAEATKTAANAERLGFHDVSWSRGESVYLQEVERSDSYHALLTEGLGTKNRVADLMRPLEFSGEPLKARPELYYEQLAQDTVAMIVNDMATLGALPTAVVMNLAVGESAWFLNGARRNALELGWRKACDEAGCTWGGGETPALPTVINPNTAVLSGAAMGIIYPRSRVIKPHICEGDAIVLLKGSGVHANGLTLAREIADKIGPGGKGYEVEVEEGISFGAALLEPTPIYVSAVEEVLNAGIDLHYAANITGHGWRKLMRANEPFVYVIENAPKPQPVFDFIAKMGSVSREEMYSTYNMGAGFALYLPPQEVDDALEVITAQGYTAWEAGHVDKSGGSKRVVVPDLDLVFEGESLQIR